jgi:FMN-dependent NADH-azoreductase
MPTLLHIDSSPRTASVSTRLSAALVEKWKRQHPDGTVVYHNTTLERVPYIDEPHITAAYTAVAQLTPAQRRTLALSDKFVDELLAANVIVFGVPMWSLGIPASLKAWIDMVVRAGRTFAFTESGVGPLIPAGKKVYVISARGGAYLAGTPAKALDHQEPYLRTILSFLGLTDIEFIYAENQSRGSEAAAAGYAKAERTLAQLEA